MRTILRARRGESWEDSFRGGGGWRKSKKKYSNPKMTQKKAQYILSFGKFVKKVFFDDGWPHKISKKLVWGILQSKKNIALVAKLPQPLSLFLTRDHKPSCG